jgi:hypothetical protein
MKTTKTQLKNAFGAMTPASSRPAEDFWEDFKARASLVPQTRTAARPLIARSWAMAVAAAALVALVAVVGQLLPDAPESGVAQGGSAAPPQLVASSRLSHVEDVQVFVDNASVTVFEDNENGGTVVFVESLPVSNHI